MSAGSLTEKKSALSRNRPGMSSSSSRNWKSPVSIWAKRAPKPRFFGGGGAPSGTTFLLDAPMAMNCQKIGSKEDHMIWLRVPCLVGGLPVGDEHDVDRQLVLPRAVARPGAPSGK